MGLAAFMLATVLVVLMVALVTTAAGSEPTMTDPRSIALINEMNEKLATLIRHMKSRPELLRDRRVRRLISRFGTKRITSMPPGNGAAYTLDKGREVRMCTEGDIDTATFVMLHEMAHIMTETNGHDYDFWMNFTYVLEIAVDAGVYRSQPFSKERPGNYCGKTITYQPLSNLGQRVRDDHRRRLNGWT